MKIYHTIAVCLICLLFFSGCATNKNFGKIVENHKVTSIFRSHTILDNYNYYYFGVFDEPDVILGLDKEYTVVSKLWSPVELTPELLERWVIDLDRILGDRNFSSRYMGRYQGAYILNPEGRQVGLWYSKLDWGAFEFLDEKIVIPYKPSLRPGSELIRFRDY